MPGPFARLIFAVIFVLEASASAMAHDVSGIRTPAPAEANAVSSSRHDTRESAGSGAPWTVHGTGVAYAALSGWEPARLAQHRRYFEQHNLARALFGSPGLMFFHLN